MTRSVKSARLPLGLVTGVLVAAVGSLLAISAVLASPATIGAGSATIVPGAKTNIDLSVTPTGTEKVGTIKLDLAYDSALLEVTGPFPDEQGVIPPTKGTGACNALTAGKIICAVASTSAMSGSFVTIEFKSKAGVGTASLALTGIECSDTLGGPLTCTASNGTITIANPTPTPSPVPATPTAAPTATPKTLPVTGGPASDGSSSVPWALGVLGLAVLAGGVWVTARTRRESL